MTRALIIADPQRDFCEGGSLGVAGGAAAVSRIDSLLKGDHGYDYLIATRDHHINPGLHFADEPDFVSSWPPHCVVGTPGSEFHDNLTFRDFSAVIYKGHYAPAYSAFEGVTADGEKLSRWLRDRGVDQVDVCGIATDYCVRSTALDAVREDFETTVLLDLTAAVAPDRVPEISAELRAAGIAIKESVGRAP
ncbi:MAG TPA: isochorismatase family protein [Propionibacteriaceae bacterium]|nr:isochorismatase family protein [Propionibacteriaceae bacterium]